MKSPNKKQKKFINSIKGIYLVDAGPGTGKTFTLTRRYSKILEKTSCEPGDILLTTFTENAADQMKERIVNSCDHDRSKLVNAPITTFHSFCKDLLEREGVDAPSLIGIEESLAGFNIVESFSSIFESREFRRFYANFKDEKPSYGDLFKSVKRPEKLLSLIKKLCSKGIYPKKDGWYRKSEGSLLGYKEKMSKIFEEINRPLEGSRGVKNSVLKNKLYGFDDNLYDKDSPKERDLRPTGSKKVPRKFFDSAFDEEREQLFSFVHDLFYGYIRHSVENGFLNFQFLTMFSYILLTSNPDVREKERFDHVMVDEFQDTSEIQFKIAMILSRNGNLAAVGDWKQSIFSFRYASVDNILEFGDKLDKFKEDLNSEQEIVEFETCFERISLDTNYRSTQKIIDFSEQCFSLKGSSNEMLDENNLEDITSLRGTKENIDSTVECLRCEKEKDSILWKIQRIVDNQDYSVKDENIDYGDVAVLTRTKKFGIALEKLARKHGIPASFEGGVKLFRTDPGKLLLAWLRIVSGRSSERGWALVLDHAGYGPDQLDHMLNKKEFPHNMLKFRKTLGDMNPPGVAEKVFKRYGIKNGFTSKIVSVLEDVYRDRLLSFERTTGFVEECFEKEVEFDVESNYSENSITIQTIHKAKGLEYPVVFVPDLNQSHFPSRNPGFAPIDYKSETGLRQRKKYSSELEYVVDNWKSRFLYKCFPTRYDEERRLLYVAMTRAENHLFITAQKDDESNFFEGIESNKKEIGDVKVESVDREFVESPISFSKSEKKMPLKISAHQIMEKVLDIEEGRGTEFGNKIHDYAESLLKGEKAVAGEEKDFSNIKNFLEELEGDLSSERPVLLPIDTGERRVVIEGIIDLLVEDEKAVKIVDYKTDTTRKRQEEYLKQLSVYFHAVNSIFEGKKVSIHIFYTHDNDIVELDPLKKDFLADLIEERHKT